MWRIFLSHFSLSILGVFTRKKKQQRYIVFLIVAYFKYEIKYINLIKMSQLAYMHACMLDLRIFYLSVG